MQFAHSSRIYWFWS